MTDVYLLHEKNAAFLKDRSQKAIIRTQTLGIWIAGTAILALLSFLSIWMAVSSVRLHWQRSQTLETVSGHYLDKYTKMEDEDTVYYLAYSFEVDGVEYEGYQAVSSSLYDAAQVETPVEIDYNPINPQLSWIAATNRMTYGVFWFMGIATTAMLAAVANILFMFNAVGAFAQKRRHYLRASDR